MHFHFISGLPRSGSTMLSALLRQNPRFHAGVTSPLASLVSSVLDKVSVGSEWGPQVDVDRRRALLHGLFDSYYAQVENEVIFDTNRSWTAKLPVLLDLFPSARIIACVRNVAWIMDSIERLYQANPYENTRLYSSDAERSSVYSRLEALAQRNRMVGLAYSALKEAYYGAHGRSMLVVEYDLLSQRPAEVVPLIYRFLGEQPFAHDYDNLVFDTPAYDEGLGLKGLHKVRERVSFERRETILPPDLFDQYARLSFWRDTEFGRTNVLMVKADGNAVANARPVGDDVSRRGIGG
jgi:sulfotransferase